MCRRIVLLVALLAAGCRAGEDKAGCDAARQWARLSRSAGEIAQKSYMQQERAEESWRHALDEWSPHLPPDLQRDAAAVRSVRLGPSDRSPPQEQLDAEARLLDRAAADCNAL